MGNLKVLLGIIFFGIFCFSANPAQGFEFFYQEKKFEVSQEILESFKGIGALPKKTNLEKNAKSNVILLAYLGAPEQKTNEFYFYRNKPEKIYNYLKTIAAEINRPKVEPILEINNGIAVKFASPKDGISLNMHSSTVKILNALEKSEASAELQAETDAPQKSLAAINNLGIQEIIATGESNFKGSPKNRIHNIKVGVEKMKGVIIKPGEEFSFNKYLGPVEAENGFLPELVIKKTGTVPEFGGGLCQVSSTTFRAAMNAGLPITQRKNHSYAVTYYAPQGTDATIYPGVIDLKFLNDMPGAVLIWPYFKDAYTLVFEFYGTRDGRKITLQKPLQYDRKPDGSLKAEWTRIVEKAGEISTSTFKSVYQSPALFRKVETFPTTTPTTGLQIPQIN